MYLIWRCCYCVVFPTVVSRHVIWASSSSGNATFPGFADAFARASSSGLEGDWFRAHHQISILSQAIEGAAHTLMDVI